MFCCQLLCFTVMDAAEIARRDQVVDMHIPQRGAILCLVLAEEPLELAQAFHLGAVETEPARYLGEITPDVGRVHRIDAMRSELMCLGPIAAVALRHSATRRANVGGIGAAHAGRPDRNVRFRQGRRKLQP
jgi:hypothetical protein